MDILQGVLSVFLVIAVGAAARRYGLIGESFIGSANSLCYYLLLPVLLFREIGKSNFHEAFDAQLILGGYAATIGTFLLAALFSRALATSPGERGAFIQGAFRGNLAYVGLPIVMNVVGNSGLQKAGIFLGFMTPLMNVLAVLALVLPHRNETGMVLERVGKVTGRIVTNPLILSSSLGIVWSLLKFPLPGLVDKTFATLSSATLPLSLLCLGGAFSLERAKSGFRLAVTAAAMKAVLVPALGLLAYRMMGVSGDDMRIGIIMLGCPTAVATYVMASQLEGDTDLAGTIVVFSTVASLFSITAWLYFLRATMG